MPILDFGTEEQKKKFLTPLATGEKLGAFGLTEPGAGTDASGQHTKAVKDGDEYVLNGSKVFITNGYYADTYVIFAMTNKDLRSKGISDVRPCRRSSMPGWADTKRMTPEAIALPEAYAKSARRRMRLLPSRLCCVGCRDGSSMQGMIS